MKLVKIILGIMVLYLVISFFLPIFPHFTKHSYTGGGVAGGIFINTWYTRSWDTLMVPIIKGIPPEKELLKECPDSMFQDLMPHTEQPKNPSSYYIKDGIRREIQEYDHEWLRANCTIPVQKVY